MDIDEMLGIDLTNPLDRDAVAMAENDERLLDELVAMRKGLTQQQVADRMGISQSAVARIESGERDPRLSTIRRYALAVGAVVDHSVRRSADLDGPVASPPPNSNPAPASFQLHGDLLKTLSRSGASTERLAWSE